MFPREGMPPIARELGMALPLTYYLEVMRGIILKGVGLQELWWQTIALVGFAGWFVSWGDRTRGDDFTRDMSGYTNGRLQFWVKSPINLEARPPGFSWAMYRPLWPTTSGIASVFH